MGLPLAVVLSSARQIREITGKIADLQMVSSSPGGWRSARVRLHQPLTNPDGLIGAFSLLSICDARSGELVWQGRLDTPGRSTDGGGLWDLAALGGAAEVNTNPMPRVYIDRRLQVLAGTQGGSTAVTKAPLMQVGEGKFDPTQPESLALGWQVGAPLTVGGYGAIAAYPLLHEAGQKLGRLSFTHVDGGTDANDQIFIVVRVNGSASAGTALAIQTFSTAVQSQLARFGNEIAAGTPEDWVEIQTRRITSAATAADTTQAQIYNLLVRAALLDSSGALISAAGSYSNGYVLPHEVVTDAIGAGLLPVDAASAQISQASTFQIAQLAYESGVDGEKLLGDLLAFDPTMTWRCGALDTASGNPRFFWEPLETSPRYHIQEPDGFDSPGASSDLANVARVRYLDATGAVRWITRTSSQPDLALAGLTRAVIVDLGSEAATLAQAQAAGDQALSAHAQPTNGGTLVVQRPVRDLMTGRWCQPWEIRPGALIRIGGISPARANSGSTRDGTTVYRITENSYSLSQGATLSLDGLPVTVSQLFRAQSRVLSSTLRRR